ncbi:Peptide deformylase [Seminavis robusta]|uniref:Peptide deformylase n=1 Tax=Seminavis robusta TaxID=568900 RepID=A0A9N8DH91_9STRA|nr:Peptide deformylase [Seminavis robusta]|eukprot:Sro85_g045170.1 Peptide deformylase (242) ;mRNA; r:19742-20600
MLVYTTVSMMLCSALFAGSSSRALAFQAAKFGFKRPMEILPPQTTRLFSKSLENEVDPGQVEGTDLRIVKYPHPSLRAENEEIQPSELKDGSIAQLAKEMFLYMYEAEGVGLAAPQVGVNKRFMVYNQSGDKTRWLDEIVMVNPRIVEYSEAKETDEEGCLSFPDMSGDVERSKWIKVEALNLRGKKLKRKFTGWEARIFQHEYDHLDGVVYIDRLSEKGKKEVQPVLDKLVDDFGEGGVL